MVLLQRRAFPKLPAIVEIEDQQFAEQVRPFGGRNLGQESVDSRATGSGLPSGLELVANPIGPLDLRQRDESRFLGVVVP